jgi:hypothetical protein
MKLRSAWLLKTRKEHSKAQDNEMNKMGSNYQFLPHVKQANQACISKLLLLMTMTSHMKAGRGMLWLVLTDAQYAGMLPSERSTVDPSLSHQSHTSQLRHVFCVTCLLAGKGC